VAVPSIEISKTTSLNPAIEKVCLLALWQKEILMMIRITDAT